MQVREYDATDAAAVEAGRAVLNAARAVDSPWIPPVTAQRRAFQVRHGWDGSPVLHLLAHADGVPVALAAVELGSWDNRELGWVHLQVHPERRRRGLGSAFLGEVLTMLRERGCTKAGASGWDGGGTEEFAAAHGFVRGSQEVHRVLRPRELPAGFADRAYAEAARAASDYELVRIAGRSPEELLPTLSTLHTAINDAPVDDLDIEDEVFPVERVRDYEDATLGSAHRLYRVLARHRATGEPAGHTVVAVDTEVPTVGHQHDTSVVRDHRGHRLGLLLKAEMMRWLAEAEPQLESLDTWNAATNDHMIAVNERLGYRPMGLELEFQRRL